MSWSSALTCPALGQWDRKVGFWFSPALLQLSVRVTFPLYLNVPSVCPCSSQQIVNILAFLNLKTQARANILRTNSPFVPSPVLAPASTKGIADSPPCHLSPPGSGQGPSQHPLWAGTRTPALSQCGPLRSGSLLLRPYSAVNSLDNA